MNDVKSSTAKSWRKSWSLWVLILALLAVPLAIGAASSSPVEPAQRAESQRTESQRTELGRVVEQEPSGQEPAVRPRRERAPEARSGRGYLGVQVDDLTRGLRQHFGVQGDVGVLVEDVEADTPAAAAGLVAGDVVVAIAGEPVASARGLTRAIHARPGETVALEVVRDGRTVELTATLGETGRSTRVRRSRVEADDVAEDVEARVAEALEGVDWDAIGDRGEQFGEELEQRLEQAFDAKDWEEFGKRWEDWGEQQGKHWEEWGERFAERFENMDWEEFGERWAEWGEGEGEKWAEWGERFADDWAGNSEHWAELGERISDSVGSVDWDGLGEMIERIVSEVMSAVEDLPDHNDRE